MSRKLKDLSGLQFGRWTVIRYSHKREVNGRSKHYWHTSCVCGNVGIVPGKSLKDGSSKSCGCIVKGNSTIGDLTRTHGMTGTPLYKSWQKMKERCLNPNYSEARYYSEKGIKLCDEWHDFISFRDWALQNGYKKGLSIDRINSNGNYEPNNCRWATVEQQQNNKSNNIRIEYLGRVQTLADWCRELDIKYLTAKNRYDKGMTAEKIFFEGDLRHANTEVSGKTTRHRNA